MKKTLLTLFIGTMALMVNAQNILDKSNFYRIHTVKLKHGAEKEAATLGTKLFSKSLAMLGINVKVLKCESGDNDLMVIVPVEAATALQETDQYTQQFQKNLVKAAGSESDLKNMLDRYNSLVLKEDTYYLQNRTGNPLGVSEYYRVRMIQVAHGKTKEAADIGIKYFDSSLAKQGIQTMVLTARTGSSNLMIIEPIPTDSPFRNKDPQGFGQSMLDAAGSEAQLSKDLNRYNELVIDEDVIYLSQFKIN